MRVYLDNAASTPMMPEVLEAMLPYFSDTYGNPSSVHYHGRQLRNAVENARRTVAELLGCSPGEIIFTSGGTEADNMAIKCSAQTGNIRQIITSPLEHHAVLHSVETVAKYHGIPTHYLQPDAQGVLDLNELEHQLKQHPNATLVTLMHGNNEIGTLNDIQAIAHLCKQYGAIYHSDTVQTMGHVPFDLKNTPVDLFVASAHKFYGPKGIGFLYKSPNADLPALLCGGGQERNQRAGTENVAGIVGLAKALTLVKERYDSIHTHLLHLKSYFMNRLREEIQGVRFNGLTDADRSLPTVLNVTFPLQDQDSMLLFNLDIRQISASGGSACSSGSVHPSHVLKAIGLDATRAGNSVRFSFGCQNTVSEIDYVVNALKEIITPVPVGS
jgi:cysteine desulfurase